LFNAQAATGIPAREWCAHADTVSVCSSKGLGAPVGSLLAGDGETISEGRRARKAFGGGMRQAGIIAAASLYAFENNTGRLSEDHERARNLAAGLREAGYDAREPDTNLVLVAVDDPPEFLRALAREGVLATLGKPGFVRLCTNLDVGDGDIEIAIEAATRIFATTSGR
jgi:threonine aldolase